MIMLSRQCMAMKRDPRSSGPFCAFDYKNTRSGGGPHSTNIRESLYFDAACLRRALILQLINDKMTMKNPEERLGLNLHGWVEFLSMLKVAATGPNVYGSNKPIYEDLQYLNIL